MSDDESELESGSSGSVDNDIPQLSNWGKKSKDSDSGDEFDEEDEIRFGEALDDGESLGADC